MRYNKKEDKKIVTGEIEYNNIKIANYVIFKPSHSLEDKFSWIEIIPAFEVIGGGNFEDNVGNALTHSFSDWNMTEILTSLNNDWKQLKNTNKDIYSSIKGLWNYIALTEKTVNKIISILNYTIEDEELGIYNDFKYYFFDMNTFNKSVLWFLTDDNFPLLENKKEWEIIKAIVHSYVKSWLIGRYDIDIFSKKY